VAKKARTDTASKDTFKHRALLEPGIGRHYYYPLLFNIRVSWQEAELK